MTITPDQLIGLIHTATVVPVRQHDVNVFLTSLNRQNRRIGRAARRTSQAIENLPLEEALYVLEMVRHATLEAAFAVGRGIPELTYTVRRVELAAAETMRLLQAA